MRTLDGGALSDAQVEELAPCGEAPSSGIPLEAVAVVWEPLTKEQREAYERLHGYPPPGYRGTGPVWWFARSHPDTGPCVQCGAVTDRWELRETSVGMVNGTPHVNQSVRDTGHRALCGLLVPFCARCGLIEDVAKARRIANNPEVSQPIRD